MADQQLYDDLIMNHIENARNYRALDNSNREAGVTNPLCGDELRVYLMLDGDHIVRQIRGGASEAILLEGATRS